MWPDWHCSKTSAKWINEKSPICCINCSHNAQGLIETLVFLLGWPDDLMTSVVQLIVVDASLGSGAIYRHDMTIVLLS